MNEGEKGYRENLAKDIKEFRKKGEKEKAREYLELSRETSTYEEAKDAADEKKLDKIRAALGVERESEKKEISAKAVMSILFDLERRFIGEEGGEKAAKKISEIIGGIDKFINNLQKAYIEKRKSEDISPDDFMKRYGIGSTTGGVGGVSGKRMGAIDFDLSRRVRFGRTKNATEPFQSVLTRIFFMHYEKKKHRLIPFGKWKEEEINEKWFTPKQEKALYDALSAEPIDDSNLRDLQKNPHAIISKGRIPHTLIEMEPQHSMLHTQYPGEKPIRKGSFTQNYGFKWRESTLSFDPQAIKEILEEAEKAL